MEVRETGGKLKVQEKLMKITERDVEILSWILEQKFMTERQVGQVFWKGLTDWSREVNKRLNEMRKAGLLKKGRTQVYRSSMYLVTREGVRQLKAFGRDQGLGEVRDTDYADYRHDLVVTDIRMMFHGWGYRDWLSERVLLRRNDLKRIPDGMIFNQGKYIAVEYEASQKSKRRYREIFLNYGFDKQIDKVIYVAATAELTETLLKQGSICRKLHFVLLEDLKKDPMRAKLTGTSGECSLRDLLGEPR